jgi:hypothetical protein
MPARQCPSIKKPCMSMYRAGCGGARTVVVPNERSNPIAPCNKQTNKQTNKQRRQSVSQLVVSCSNDDWSSQVSTFSLDRLSGWKLNRRVGCEPPDRQAGRQADSPPTSQMHISALRSGYSMVSTLNPIAATDRPTVCIITIHFVHGYQVRTACANARQKGGRQRDALRQSWRVAAAAQRRLRDN